MAPRTYPGDAAEVLARRRRLDPAFDGDSQVDFPKMRSGGLDCAFFIVFTGQRENDGAGFVQAKRHANLMFAAIHRMADLYPHQIVLATDPDDVEPAWRSGKLVACIGIENGYPMGEDLSLVEQFHKRGARYMGIAHTGHNQLGDAHTPPEPLHGGLSELGVRAVQEMNRVGIMPDVSHASKATAMQVIATSSAPVIASHSGCAALYTHSRNMDDELLQAMAAKGGVIQVVAFESYLRDYTERNKEVRALREELGLPRRRSRDAADLSPEELETRLAKFEKRMVAINDRHPRTNVTHLVDHIDHAVNLIGLDHVGISSDFDGGGGIEGWDNAAETFNVTLELVRRGYTEAQIHQLWSGNLLRVWRAVRDHAK